MLAQAHAPDQAALQPDLPEGQREPEGGGEMTSAHGFKFFYRWLLGLHAPTVKKFKPAARLSFCMHPLPTAFVDQVLSAPFCLQLVYAFFL